ncbi:hypothetical protein ACIQD2_05955 [Dietzia maris]
MRRPLSRRARTPRRLHRRLSGHRRTGLPGECRQPGPHFPDLCGDASETGVEVGEGALQVGLLGVHP